MAAADMVFTRGGASDDRGESMVQKHAEKLQQEKEERCMSSIKGELPNISPAVLALALQEARWDVPAAMQLVSIFLQACGSHLEDLKQKHFVPRQSAVAAGHPPAAASGSDDSSPARPRHKRKGKSKKDKSKKDKKHKRRHAEKDAPTSTEQFGKYGIIREADADRYSSEYTMWAIEVKGIDVETIPKWEEKELLKTFIEDYNTGTLPHKKYYDLAAYEEKKALKAREGGSDEDVEKAVFNDEAEVAAARKREELIAQQERLREAYNELKYTAPDKVEAMRDQEMTRMKMSLAYRTGDRETAEMLANKLKSDEARQRDAAAAEPPAP
ncbi:g7456 [Coccomyxa viridis]|uniref:G7456 protein n=1 Tax=Coccomyxa viridis TaxID=1274662 RepID=A0ABP1FXW3_9CHLO